MRIISILFLAFCCLVNTVYAVTNEEITMVKKIRDSYKNDKPRSILSAEEHERYDFHYFNFGATGRAAGISVEALLMISDNKRDQEYIQEGIKYYDEEYGKKYDKMTWIEDNVWEAQARRTIIKKGTYLGKMMK